ncbi:MAG: flavodoxin [Mangrovibacterium sp.]
MEKIAVVYGSSSGNTETIAKTIAKKIGVEQVETFDVAKIAASVLEPYKNLILGTSTWGVGDLQDDWEAFLPSFEKTDLSGKTVALFGLGDSSSYPDSFVDGMGIIYEAIQNKGCKIVGAVETKGYSFDDSRALVNGKFIGLPLDEDNESDQSDQRVDQWLKQILTEFA